MKKLALTLFSAALLALLPAFSFGATGTIIVKNPHQIKIITINPQGSNTTQGEELELVNGPPNLQEGDNIIFMVIETGPPHDRQRKAVYQGRQE